MFTYTGASQSWQVPTGITSIDVELLGGQGGGTFGGLGARVRATLPVTAGETLQIYVGGAGSTSAGFNGGGTGGTNGRGGAGASDIRQGGSALTNRVATAAGGGGSKDGDPGSAQYGGSGGVTTGEAGGGNTCGSGGGGATQSAGGAAAGSGATAGSLGTGGTATGFAGGGGGGFYGGGGGSPSCNTGGGAGSSNTTAGATGVQMWQGWNLGNGKVTISWPAGGWTDPTPPAQPHEFSTTSSPQVYLATGVSADVDVYGGEGDGVFAGLGARVRATIPTALGQPLLLVVGGKGTNVQGGYNGGASSSPSPPDPGHGGGGGATDVRIGGWALQDRVVVAGAGGGSWLGVWTAAGGSGGVVGETGDPGKAAGCNGGGGGTASAGGAAGGNGAFVGTFGRGGDSQHLGGAGGGGWYGGGGGAVCNSPSAGGGGGSSYTTPGATNVQTWQGYRLGDGYARVDSGATEGVIVTLPNPETRFNVTGGPQTYVVPSGKTSVGVVLAGASGELGGGAGVALANVSAAAGTPITVVVGATASNGLGGYNGGGSSTGPPAGGGGGGATDIRVGGRLLADRMLVGGGGGGGSTLGPARGGAGGGDAGVAGDNGNGVCQWPGGGGGTQTGPGTGAASPGVADRGGDAIARAGAGGGGWFGGGGGAAGYSCPGHIGDASPSGGGGGSGHAGSLASNVLLLGGGSFGDGWAVIGQPLPPVGGLLTKAERAAGCNTAERCVGHQTREGSWPINTPDGAFWHTFSDFAFPGRGPSLNFSHTYDSVFASQSGPLGFGWSHPYMMNVTVAGTVATVTQENGAQVTFNQSGSNWVPAAPRVFATLVHNGDSTWTFKRAGGRQIFGFDTQGRLATQSDLNGNTLSLTWTSGRLTAVTDPQGRALTFLYDASGQISSVTDQSSHAVAFTYDGAGNLATATEPNGGVWSFTYDSAHLLLTMLDPNQQSLPVNQQHPVTNHYNAQGQVDSQTDQLSRQTTFAYALDANENGTVTITDPKGNQVQDQYTYGQKTAVIVGYGTSSAATTTYSYDPSTLLPTAITNPNQHTTLYTYDAQGNLTSSRDPALGRLSTATFNSMNEPLTVTDAIGNTPGKVAANYTTTYSYDSRGDLTQISTPCVLADGTTSCGTRTSAFHRDNVAHPDDVTSITDPRNKTSTFSYDGSGNLNAATDPLGNQTTSCFDALGRMTAQISPSGVAAGVTCTTTPPAAHTTYFTYDAVNAPLTVTDPLGHQTVSTYDLNGNLKTFKDPKLHLTQYGYDAAGQMQSITRPDTTVMSYDYWPDGTLHTQYDAQNHATIYTYDPLGRLSSVTDPNNRTTSYGYDLAGNLLTKQDPGGNCNAVPKTGCTTSSYDVANELTSVVYSDGVTPNISNVIYDPDGQRTSLTDGTGTSTWTRDSLHRVTAHTDGAGQTMSYGYDLNSNLTSIVYPGTTGTVSRGYDDANRLHTITDWNTNQTTFNYNADSFLTSQVYPNGTTATHNPDGAEQLASISDAPTATPNSPFATFGYTRDDNGQITAANPTGVGQANQTYTYTSLNQLQSLNGANYTYDSADNLTGTPAGTKLAYDSANQLCWTATTTAACASPPSGATTYTYEGRGNRSAMTPPTGNPTVNYTYDQANRLSELRGAEYRTAVLSSNPIGYWRLGEPSGTTASDSSGNAHTGTTTGTTWGATSALTTDANTAATFNGTSGYVNVGDLSVGESSTFTTEGWVKTTTTANAPWIVSEASTTSNTPLAGISLDSTGTKARFFVRDNANVDATIIGAKTVNDGAWHHVVGVRNGTSFKLYVDGQPDGTVTATLGTISLNTTALGALKRAALGNYLNGTIDEAALYPRSLSVAEVNSHYQSGKSNYAGTATANAPTAYWRLGETSGTTAADASPNTHPGTFTGGFTLNVTGALTSDTNKAVTFNGTTGYVNAGDLSVGESSTFTTEGWVKTTTTANAPWIVSEASTTSNTPLAGISLDSTGTKARFFVRDNANVDATIIGAKTVNDGAWHHVVGVRNGTSFKLYVDGQPDGTATATLGTISLNTTALGALKRAALGNYLNGTIDEAALYATALDPATIGRHYRNGTNATPTVAAYTYDGSGLRTSKTVTGTTNPYTWDTAQGPPLLASDGTNQYIYGPGGLPLEQINNAGTVYFHHDQQGSTRALTSQSGTVVATQSTDPHGNPTASSGTTQTSFAYDGEYRDRETGFTYLRGRYYDPTTTQFLTRDPANAITQSAYNYVNGDPLNETDPLGLYPWDGYCITYFSDNCVSYADTHPVGAQRWANLFGGIWNGMTLGHGRGLLDNFGPTKGKVDYCSKEYRVGTAIGISIDILTATAAVGELGVAAEGAGVAAAGTEAPTVVNLGGEGEVADAINVQPARIAGRSDIAVQNAERVAAKSAQPVVLAAGDELPFATGSVDQVWTNNVPIGTGSGYFGPDFDPNEILRILKPGGTWLGSSAP